MSYLGHLRLTFAGAFQADVSTVNNDPEHFDDTRFEPRFQTPGKGATNGWWNPTGSGAWRLRDARVSQALGPQGELMRDVVLGARLLSREDRAPAKLVDLDPEQQMVSTIFGLGLRLETADGALVFAGEFEPAPFADIWVRMPGGNPDSFFGAMYQSVITAVTWGEAADRSPIASALRAATAEGMLSIKFNVDGFDDDSTSPTFTFGRIVGSIGPYLPAEPHHFVVGRLLTAPAGGSLNTAPARADVDARTLLLDLGNSLPTTRPGGPLQPLGLLRIGVQSATGTTEIGVVDTQVTGLYEVAAGIQSLPLTEQAATLVADNPLVVHDDEGNVLLAEAPDGRFLRPDAFVFRMDPVPGSDQAEVSIYALRFGVPEAGVPVTMVHENSAEQGQVKQGPLPGPPVGVPAQALTLPGPVVTGPDGVATATLSCTDPGNPRGYIDGQVYGVAIGWDGDVGPSNGYELSVLVFSDYPVPDAPTWVGHVQPILAQYANLYPVMKGIVDLGDYASVLSRRGMLDLSMSLPITDPNAMPVTRDLALGKRTTILKWLSQPEPLYVGPPDVETLRHLLQTAIELEHATIPTYLYALFSIKPGRNSEIAGLIRSVVVEEMLHMVLACNLLNAVGGHPALNHAGFVPTFPGHLPGDVRPDLEVHLRALSIEQVRDVFMSIEEPEKTRGGEEVVVDTTGVTVDAQGYIDNAPAATAAAASAADVIRELHGKVAHNRFTIGWYYNQIIGFLKALDVQGSLFTGDPALQVTPAMWPHAPGRLYRVHDLRTALLAIHEIERQGEGTSLNDPHGGAHELAHYFRYSEIVAGNRYVKTSSGEWDYAGDPIRFDPEGVWPVTADPALTTYSSLRAQQSAEAFDANYAGMLDLLHDVVNGAPEKLRAAVGTMFSLELQAQDLVQLPIADGSTTTAGPRFQAG